jgi:hypothetical protein
MKNIEPIQGYDWRNYDKHKGIDASGTDIISNKVIEQVANLILAGYTDDTVKTILYDVYGMNSYCTKFIIMKAHRYIIDFEEKQEQNMLQKQNSRLFGLYRKAMDNNDNLTALKILAEINRVNKLYVTKVEVNSDVFTLDLGLNVNNNDEGNK